MLILIHAHITRSASITHPMWAEQNKSRASRPSKQQDFSPLPHSAAVVAATTEKTAAERRNARKNCPLKIFQLRNAAWFAVQTGEWAVLDANGAELNEIGPVTSKKKPFYHSVSWLCVHGYLGFETRQKRHLCVKNWGQTCLLKEFSFKPFSIWFSSFR